jgi:hypothetical protein
MPKRLFQTQLWTQERQIGLLKHRCLSGSIAGSRPRRDVCLATLHYAHSSPQSDKLLVILILDQLSIGRHLLFIQTKSSRHHLSRHALTTMGDPAQVLNAIEGPNDVYRVPDKFAGYVSRIDAIVPMSTTTKIGACARSESCGAFRVFWSCFGLRCYPAEDYASGFPPLSVFLPFQTDFVGEAACRMRA